MSKEDSANWLLAEQIAVAARHDIDPAVRRLRRWMWLEQAENLSRTAGYTWQLSRKTRQGDINAVVWVTLTVDHEGNPFSEADWQELTEEGLLDPATRIRRLFTLPLYFLVAGIWFLATALVPVVLIVVLVLLLVRCSSAG